MRALGIVIAGWLVVLLLSIGIELVAEALRPGRDDDPGR